MLILHKNKTKAWTHHTPQHISRVSPVVRSNALNLPTRCCLLFTLIPSKLLLFTSPSAALPPLERKSMSTWSGWAPIPERSVPSLVALFASQRPQPGELCPCALRRQGTRHQNPTTVFHGGGGGGHGVKLLEAVKQRGRAWNPTWKCGLSASSPSSAHVLQSRSRSVTSFARQQPVNRRLLSPPAVNSW